MKTLKTIGFALVAGLVGASAAQAADAYTPIQTTGGEALPVYDYAEFDWTGFYAGVYGATQNSAGGWEFGPGIAVGGGTQLDYFYLGGEVAAHGVTNGTTGRYYGQALARAGVVVTDEVLVYAAGGFGTEFNAAPNQHALVGGGLEFAVTEDVSLKGQYLYGAPVGAGSTPVNQVSLGANWHF